MNREAAAKAAAWWADRLNDCPSEKIDRFRQLLSDRLTTADDQFGYCCLFVDYDQPCPILGQALIDADINPWWALPAKHRMWINRDRVEVREGYPSEIVEVK